MDVTPSQEQCTITTTAVLQPLTLSSATLTIVKSNVTLLVEKLMTFSNVTCDFSDGTRSFVEKNVQSLCHQKSKKHVKGKDGSRTIIVRFWLFYEYNHRISEGEKLVGS